MSKPTHYVPAGYGGHFQSQATCDDYRTGHRPFRTTNVEKVTCMRCLQCILEVVRARYRGT